MMAIKILVVTVWILAVIICIWPDVGHAIHRWFRNRNRN